MTDGKRLPWYPPCFVCGDLNACGTRMRWERVDGGVEGRYHAAERHSGFEGILHGGILAALLDECAGWAAALRCQALCFTGELKVRYLRPAPTGKDYVVRGTCPDDGGEARKYITAIAEVVDADGARYATCEGRFFPLPPEIEARAIENLVAPEGAGKWPLTPP